MKGYLFGEAKLIVCVMFFLSGATALFYEVLWARLLRLVFGDTLLATAAPEAALEELAALGAGQPGGAEAGVQSAMLLAAMAEQKLRRSQPREELGLLTRAMRHGPEMAYLQVMRGRICEQLGDLPEARRAYRKSREISDRLSQPPIPLAQQRLAELPAAD
jgi:predicted Zn-dependent protease